MYMAEKYNEEDVEYAVGVIDDALNGTVKEGLLWDFVRGVYGSRAIGAFWLH